MKVPMINRPPAEIAHSRWNGPILVINTPQQNATKPSTDQNSGHFASDGGACITIWLGSSAGGRAKLHFPAAMAFPASRPRMHEKVKPNTMQKTTAVKTSVAGQSHHCRRPPIRTRFGSEGSV